MFHLPALDILNIPTLVGFIFMLLLGSWLKKNPDFKNRLIGWVNLGIAILTQIVAQLTGATDAHAAVFGVVPIVAVAPWLQSLVHGILDVIAQTWLTTGAHSWTKNTVKGDTGDK